MKFLVEFLDVARHRPERLGDVVQNIEYLTAV
jgi:hypothetical protein